MIALRHRSRHLPRTLLLLLCLLVLPATAADTEPAAAAFEQANRLYEQGHFTDAAAAYEQILSQGKVSAALYFNLGNAWFRAGRPGKAMVCFLLARRLAPRDPDIRANLQFARQSVAGGEVPVQRLERFLTQLTLNEWTASLMVAAWIWLLLLAARLWQPSWRPTLRGYTATAGVLTTVLAALWGTVLIRHATVQHAVVTLPEAAARYGPIDESQTAFVLREGAEVEVLDRRGPWQLVVDPTRRSGWVNQEAITELPRWIP
jgi:tetratricopeptide (TPR) repeat protein